MNSFINIKPTATSYFEDSSSDLLIRKLPYNDFRIDLSPDFGFKGVIWCNSQWISADVEARFSSKGLSRKAKWINLPLDKREALLLKTFNVEIRRFPEGGGRLVITPKLLGGGVCHSRSQSQNNSSNSESVPSQLQDTGNNQDEDDEDSIQLTFHDDPSSNDSEPQLRPYRGNPLVFSSETPFVDLEQKLEGYKASILTDDEVRHEIASYTSARGSRNIFDSKEQTFDLNENIGEFLESDQPIFLLFGDSGGGKSTYLRYLRTRFLYMWSHTKLIPLFISLPTLKKPFEEAISETLSELGFSEQEQGILKENYSFLFLFDGYDELKKRENLYNGNHLHEWKARSVISCRTHYLNGEETSYRQHFLPMQENVTSQDPIFEAAISPFSETQVDDYLRKHIHLLPTSHSLEQFKQDIKAIPGLQEMMANPFFLRMLMDILPELMRQQQLRSLENRSVSRIEIFDAFVANWFSKEAQRLKSKELRLENLDLPQLFVSFAGELASAMMKEGSLTIDFESLSHLCQGASTESSDLNAMIRTALPLRKMGSRSYGFIHLSLFAYFVARSIIPHQQNSIAIEFLNKKLLTNEFEVLSLLSDCVKLNPYLENSFFDIINRSKCDPNVSVGAANAITILNVAGVNLSLRHFSGIKIPGANLSKAILTHTDLSKADLSSVQLNGAILDYSTIAFSNTAGIEFGQKPYLKVLEGIKSIAFSADGKWILIGHEDSTVRLWDWEKNEEILCLKGHSYWVGCVAFSNDGKKVISGSWDNTVCIWDLLYKRRICTFSKHVKSVNSVALSPDGNRVVSGGQDGIAYLWDAATGEQFFRLGGNSGGVNSVLFSPDGKWVLTGGADGKVKIWNCASRELVRSFHHHLKSVKCLACSSDSRSVLSGGDDCMVRLWNLQTGKEMFCLSGHSSYITCVAFSPDGKWALSGSRDKTIRLWSCLTGKEHLCLQGHSDGIKNVSFSSDGKWIYSGSDDLTVRQWKIEGLSQSEKSQKSTAALTDVAISQDGKRVISGSKDKTVRVWNGVTGEELVCFRGHSDHVTCVALSSDGKWAVSGSYDKTIRLWNVEKGVEEHCFTKYENVTTKLAFSPDGKKFISSNLLNSHVKLWNIATRQEEASFNNNEKNIRGLEFSPDGERILCAARTSICIWKIPTNNFSLNTKDYWHKVRCAAFSPDGGLILSGGDDTRAQLTNSETGEVKFKLIGHRASVISVAFSPNGLMLLTASEDKTISVWDSQTGLQLGRFFLDYIPTEIKWLNNGRDILLANQQPSIQMWQLLDEGNRLKPALNWTTSTAFSARRLNIEGVNNLSQANYQLLRQHGAVDEMEEKDMS